MRHILQPQIPIVYLHVDHIHGFELAVMSRILDEEPSITYLVFADLTLDGRRTNTGRDGMTAEQVIRAVIVKQMNGFSYQELAFHLADSRSYRTFCRLGINDKPPSRATLQRNIKRLRPETLEAINQILVRHADSEGVEHGRKVRVDCTGVETNIHAPTDSSLLWDCVRVLTRLLHQAEELVGFSFTDHSRRAKRRFIGIRSVREKKRKILYRDLLKVTLATAFFAENAEAPLMRAEGLGIMDALVAQGVAQELRH
ncbi:MAG: transposase, partial [Deltaproteobacteria bacterium]|nr:transposase [Deltaproteobacteria bacterium]